MEPILKWAGGKRQLLSQLLEIIDREVLMEHRFYEPFFGGGSLTFTLLNPRTVINDSNTELINVYQVVRDHPDELIRLLRGHSEEHSPEYYYEIRSLDRTAEYENMDDVFKASRIIYLNKTCFNGLYRVNSNGQYNVPIGASATKPDIVMENKIYRMSEYLNQRGIRITSQDYSEAVKTAKEGDTVYFDPPYDYEKNGFTQYVKYGFNLDDLKKLKKVFDKLSDRGCNVILSNNDTQNVRTLFNEYNIEEVVANRSINCIGSNRKNARELIISNIGRNL